MQPTKLLLPLILLGIVSLSKDYYSLLGVPRNFDQKSLKKAYLKMARKYHPDNNPGKEKYANNMFVQIQKAYETLKDPKKRKIYDMGGEEAVEKDEKYQSAGGQGDFGGGFGGFEDIIKTMFGGGGGGDFQFNFGGNQGGFGQRGQ